MVRARVLFVIATSAACVPAAGQVPVGPAAPTPERIERGRAIADEADRRARGFVDSTVRMEMILVDRGGGETLRELDVSTLEVSADETRTLVYFQSPRDIRGTGLLTISDRNDEDEQWLYLPALRRAKRISATGRSSPFMGTELAYEDLVPMYPDQFDYVYVGEEEVEGMRSWVVERTPRYEGTGYVRQRVWIDTAEYRVLQVQSWDLRDRLLKTMVLRGYEEYPGGQWRPAEATVMNHLSDAETRLRWFDYRFGVGLQERDLSRSALGRVR